MSNNGYSGARRSLTAAMIVFAAAYTLHGIDHLRRGMAASPPSIMVGGTIQGIIVVIAVVLVLRHLVLMGDRGRRNRRRTGARLRWPAGAMASARRTAEDVGLIFAVAHLHRTEALANPAAA
ncbi:MAG: hypothetical protein ACXVX6_03345 [Mycobacterium sp.]